MKRRYVVLSLAVIAALAVASPGFGVTIRKLVKKEVARQIDKATGPTGATGAPGAAGANGTARAFAFVNHFVCNAPPNDSCGVDADSKGVTEVVHKTTGHFCATVPGLSPDVAPAVASADYSNSFPSNERHFVLTSGSSSGTCTAGQYEFLVTDPDDGASDTGVNLDTSFTFIIP